MGIFDIFNTDAQRDAANSQIAGINRGYGDLSSLFGQGRNALSTNFAAGLAPFLQNYAKGAAGVDTLGNALGLGGDAGNKAAIAAFQNNPGYEFAKTQGMNAIDANQAKTGQLNSGNTNLDIAKYVTGLADQNWNQYVQNLLPFLGYSTSNAGGILTGYGGLGQGLDRSFQNQGNAAYGAQTSIGNANANADLSRLNASGNIMNLLQNGLGLGANLLGFLSDERAKDDIEEVGVLYDGQKVHRYRMKGDPRHQIGLVAQEVEQVAPEAVDNSRVLKLVDYRRATDFAAELGKFLKEAA